MLCLQSLSISMSINMNIIINHSISITISTRIIAIIVRLNVRDLCWNDTSRSRVCRVCHVCRVCRVCHVRHVCHAGHACIQTCTILPARFSTCHGEVSGHTKGVVAVEKRVGINSISINTNKNISITVRIGVIVTRNLSAEFNIF